MLNAIEKEINEAERMVTTNEKDVNELERTYQSVKNNCYLRKIVNHIKFSGDNFKVAEHLRFDKEKEMSIGSRVLERAIKDIVKFLNSYVI
uniref:Phage protein n=1 Tax=Strongyloides venezuelensis TaxID=75913 RepID=A0A0K0G4H8_STRVS